MADPSDQDPDQFAWYRKQDAADAEKSRRASDDQDRSLSGDALAVKHGLLLLEERDSHLEFLREMEEEILEGDPERALREIDHDNRGHYRVPAASWAVRGLANLVLGNLHECLADAERAIGEDRDLASAYALQAEAHYLLGEPGDAVAAVERALARSPEEPRARRIGRLLARG